MALIVPNANEFKSILHKLDELHIPIKKELLTMTFSWITLVQETLITIEQHFSSLGISQGRFKVLMTLYAQPEQKISPAELAEINKVARATMTGLLDGLEQSGWILRVPSQEDRRRYLIEITQDGKKFLEQILPEHFERGLKMLSFLTEQESMAFQAILHKISKGLLAIRDSIVLP